MRLKELWSGRSPVWLVARIILILAGPILAMFLHSSADESSPPLIGGTTDILFILFGTPLMVLVVVWFTIFANRRKRFSVARPEWLRNPFNLNQPLEFFHLAGFHFIASGAGLVLFKAAGEFRELGALLILIGGSVLLGVYLAAWVLPHILGNLENVR